MKRALLLLGIACLPSDDFAAETEFTPEQQRHWAFQKVVRPAVPPVRSPEWVRTPIDAFILARLEPAGLTPSASADKITLLRRLSLDLIGLPPTPGEVAAFLKDRSPRAYEDTVERLLASPHYGERWARHWLDLARYAESEGFKADETRPNAWRFRDYVIASLNADKPYDRFLSEQIAGDELWPDNPEARVATGFNRHYPDESNARNLMQRRQEILNDITDTVGAVFTGVTYACARCHNHKFDPILQADYYRLQAFFANTAADDAIVLEDAAQREVYRRRMTAWEEKTRALREEMNQLEEPKRREIIDDYVEKYPDEIKTALTKPEPERTPFECQMVAKARLYLDPGSHQYIADAKAVSAKLKGAERERWDALKKQLEEFAPLHPGKLPLATGITDLSAAAPATHLLRRGIWDAPRDEIAPGFLTLLEPQPARIAAAAGGRSTGRRAALARILTAPDNPLTARVMMNRIWHYHFGSGIVGTPSDFGLKGERPTHPELLDWLASEFVRQGWSIKAMHRLIVHSSTYRQSAAHRADAARRDPANRFLWRYPRHRLEGEIIRDSALAVSGLLNPALGGPSVFPELPEGMVTRGGWNMNQEGSARNRRSVYVFVRRNTRYPMFESFDMPDTHESCARRNTTTSPLQALTLLNSKVAFEWAQYFAARVAQRAGADRKKQIAGAYQLAFSRLPSAAEQRSAEDFFARQRAIIAQRQAAGQKIAALPGTYGLAGADAAALADLCHMLLNANEFVYLN